MKKFKFVQSSNCKLKKTESDFIEAFKSFCQSDKSITNVFLYGSVVQPKSEIDKLSDIDFFVLQSKFKPLKLQYNGLILLSERIYGQVRCLEFMLIDGCVVDITVFTEKEWKKRWFEIPLFYASVLKRGIKFLVQKNDFITNLPLPQITDFCISSNECNDIWQEFVSTYYNIVKMYIRNDIWRIYGYGIRLANELSRLISLKARAELYIKYSQKQNKEDIFSDPRIVFANNNWLQIGRDFKKYATQRQKQIFEIIHKLSESDVNNLLRLYDLSVEEFSELKDYQKNFEVENAELYRKYAVLWLTGRDEVTSYLEQRHRNQIQLLTLIDEFLQ